MVKEEPKKNSREFFRINYKTDQPILVIDKVKFLIIDLSEGGLRFKPKKDVHFFENNPVVGRVDFGKRGSFEVKGTIVRVSRADIAIRFDEKSRIPLARIMEEQRFLIQKGHL